MQQEEYSGACEVIPKNSYMGDLIDSCSSKEKASNIMKEIDEVLSLGGFPIKGWTSTSGNISSTEQHGKWAMQRHIARKNRVSPLNNHHIVRLGLAVAVLGTCLGSFIQSDMRYDFNEVYRIVDSNIAKAVLNKKQLWILYNRC